jgi:Tol biopolymer transport system component
MHTPRILPAAFLLLLLVTIDTVAQTAAQSAAPLQQPKETRLRNIRQLTFAGENAEAYLSFDERQLVLQAREEGMECDQIYTMNIDGTERRRVSSGKGRTTCSYWLPDDEHVIFASTHAHADDCLPAPDRSKGYVWKLYPEFDLYVMRKDGSDLRKLFASEGYDAEATVSPAGDRIVFTSTRTGDPELYTMNIDGSDVRQVTNEKGYDGGAFFSQDGSKIIFRASRPKTEQELAAYDELVREHLVRPGRLEIFVMNADGSEMRQITNNGAANFAPYMHPDGKRVIFCSNMDANDPRNFDLYVVNIDGSGLERVTWYNEFDGFPMFTRDGSKLVFCSNRNNAKSGDTNVFIADWID